MTVIIVNLTQQNHLGKAVSMTDCLDQVGIWAYLWKTLFIT